MSKQKVLVVCPGRGTYNKVELGYLKRHHTYQNSLVQHIDSLRSSLGQVKITDLDHMDKYSLPQHTAGENASDLIYACAYQDFLKINREQYDVVAVTGNSMGWYISLVCAGALTPYHGAQVINTMGSMMTQGLIGGQLIYPIVDEQWLPDPAKRLQIETVLSHAALDHEAELYISIKLGGFIVLGGNQTGIKLAVEGLQPEQFRYPMKLYNHAAFHTPLLHATSEQARNQLSTHLFQAPHLPVIDGQGHIWQPLSSDPVALHHYTLATQVYEHYNFTAAVQVSVKEFAPDKIIILGPGNTLGGAVAQALIQMQWKGLTNKASFIERQKTDPVILAMGMPEQRILAI
jgi:[acyl-carrier-protein] S-malonyltransferase